MATLREVVVPDLGDFADVPIVEVLVAEGDRVERDDPIVELETEKAAMEVPSSCAGIVRELRVKVGDTVSEGSVLAAIEVDDAGDDVGGAEEGTGHGPAESAAPSAVASAVSAELQSGSVDPRSGAPPGLAGAPAERATPEPAPVEPGPAPVPAATHAEGRLLTGEGAPVYASPGVRRLARERGVELSGLRGTGRKARIVQADVERVAAARPGAAAVGAGERVPLSRLGQIAARNLTAAWQAIPHVTHHEDADITELEAFRRGVNAEQTEVKVTMVALVLKAVAAGLDAFPRLASTLDGAEVVLHPDRHIGFAADTDGGLVVPVIRDVDARGVLGVAEELARLSAQARAGRLSPREVSGAVFTVSSLGSIGGTGFTPIINPPQVAILGVARAAMRPVWDEERFVPRLILPLSLSYDHRVIDGAEAARFCAHLARLLGDLRRLLL